MKRQPFSIRDTAALLLCWGICAGFSGVVLFEPLRELLEPLILEEAADRIDSKIRLAEIALETREPEELPSTPEVVVSEWPEGARGELTSNDRDLVEHLARYENIRRPLLVAPPRSGNLLGGYWILLEVKGKPRPYWLFSRNSLGLSSWFLPLWRSVFLSIGMLAGTLVFLHWRLSIPLNDLLRTMKNNMGNQFSLLAPRGIRAVHELMEEVNGLYEQVNCSTQKRCMILRSISHDLSGPLSRLQVQAEIGESIPADQLAGDLQLLRALAEQIRILSQEESVTEIQEFRLDPFLQRLAGSYPDGTVTVQPSGLTVVLNQAALLRTLHNLVDNGLEYGNAPVLVSARRHDGTLTISVDDAGAGLKTPTVLTMPPVQRADDRGQQRHSGLGLQIAESFCRNSGGRLQLGPSPCGGLRAELRLPASISAVQHQI